MCHGVGHGAMFNGGLHHSEKACGRVQGARPASHLNAHPHAPRTRLAWSTFCASYSPGYDALTACSNASRNTNVQRFATSGSLLYKISRADCDTVQKHPLIHQVGLDNDDAVRDTGARFRDTVLALGGSVPPADVFKRFRGREPSTKPLLQHNGLLAAASA